MSKANPQGPQLSLILIDEIERDHNHRLKRRGDQRRIDEIAKSISQSADRQPDSPVVIFESPGSPKPYKLGFGARRCAAVLKNGGTEILAVIRPPALDSHIEQVRATENLQRQDITPLEEAIAVADLMAAFREEDPDRDTDQLRELTASTLVRSVDWITRREYFTKLTEMVRELALIAEIPAGHLQEIAKLSDAVGQLKVTAMAVGLNDRYPDKLDVEASVKNDELVFVTEQSNKDPDWIEHWKDAARSNIWPLARVQEVVKNALGDLSKAGWSMSLPILVEVVPAKGKKPAQSEELRPCDGCPDRSTTHPGLFGPASERLGQCRNSACFNKKASALSRAIRQLESWSDRLKNPPLIEKIEAKTPSWMNKKAAARVVKSRMRRMAGASGTAPKSQNPIASAIKRFEKAVNEWRSGSNQKIAKAINAMPSKKLAFMLIASEKAPAFAYSNWSTGMSWTIPPTVPKPAPSLSQHNSDLFDQMVALVAIENKKIPLPIRKWLSENIELDDGDIELRSPADIHALSLVAGVELEPSPAWIDFEPKPENAKQEAKSKPSGKKKTKKKVAKKKTRRKAATA